MSYRTLRVHTDGPICRLQFHRPEANNSISSELIEECHEVVTRCGESVAVLVLEGSPEIFCFGADFQNLRDGVVAGDPAGKSSVDLMYEVWQQLAHGSFVSVAHVRGQANAGGVGFVAACDVVLADATARFSLTEMLFGLYPACVLPFLIRRVGVQRANYLAITTQPIDVEKACAWGLVDAWQENSENLLLRHLLRLRRISRDTIIHYKQYLRELDDRLSEVRPLAVRNNLEMHCRPGVLEGIVRYVDSGKFPWEPS